MEVIGSGVRMKEVRKIWECQVTESFESEKHNLVLDTLGNGEPVKLDENRCNIVSRPGAGDDSHYRVLYSLKSIFEKMALKQYR